MTSREHSPEKIKEAVPQVSLETGISQDYVNEIAGRMGLSDMAEMEQKSLNQKIAEVFLEYPIKHYEERYDPEKFLDVINRNNEERVREINTLADRMNAKYSNEHFELSDFLDDYNRMLQLIYGEGVRQVTESWL